MKPASLLAPDVATALPDWVHGTDRDVPAITPVTPMSVVITLFEANVDLRLLPVVDEERRPVGAIFERDVRRLLLNPYGHALMRNPAYGERIDGLVRPCPTAEINQPIADLLARYREAGGTEGMALTQNGRLCAVIANRRLVQLAAEVAVDRARVHMAHAQRIEQAALTFESDIASLAETMTGLAERLEAHAESTLDRAGLAGDKATAVAAAANQTGTAMDRIADSSAVLAGALERIAIQTDQAEQSANVAAQLAQQGRERATALQQSTRSIHAVVTLIGDIAAQVNLLALNASIEAARAGAAGRGFTVVANEVKALSTQTAIAAASITRHVEAITHGFEAVSGGQDEVSRAVGAIAALSTEIRGAIRLQREATRNIADHAGEVVSATGTIRADMAGLAHSAGDASTGAREIRQLARQLTQGAQRLSGEAARFLTDIRD